ncbi:hypothetical protein MMC21_000363 [Puttea exsequens]|nr:hypothetical protein [Puttea exsequens]
MAEEQIIAMPAGSGNSTPLPPIDNIHNIEPNPPTPDAYEAQAQSQPLPTLERPDTEMQEAAPPTPAQQPVLPPAPVASAVRTATPIRQVNGHVEQAPVMPTKAASHGAPARRYLNEKVTGVLLEGMKRLAAEQHVYAIGRNEGMLTKCWDRPEDPLRVLGEFLLQRSRELEGTS